MCQLVAGCGGFIWGFVWGFVWVWWKFSDQN